MNVRIAAAQYPVTYHADFEDWKAHTNRWVAEAVRQQAQLLLFPEYGSMELVSLFSKEIQADIRLQVRAMDLLCTDFCTVFADLARKYRVILVAPSFPVCVGESVYNRCLVFGPNGQSGYQDKFFMTGFESEEWNVAPAAARLCVFEAEWGCFGIQICYDVEFPIGSALLCQAGANLILAPSCTESVRGSTRVHVGARARALEQQCYTLVSPLIGNASWSPAVDINYGFAGVYSTPDHLFPEEGIIRQLPPQEPGWLVETLDLSLLDRIRQEGQTLNYKSQKVISFGLKGEDFEVVHERIA